MGNCFERMDIRSHYDLLIEENNDPFRDPPALRKYMESWDGQVFLDLMELDESKTVLEIGVGTGRLAIKTAGCCRWLTGIDISPKTIERARENLQHCLNISLTMMHFQDKRSVIGKIHALLNCKGLLCLSIDKSRSEWIDMGSRRIRIYPDTKENIVTLAEQAGMKTKRITEIENAYLLVFMK